MEHPAGAETSHGIAELPRYISEFIRRGAGRVFSANLPGGQEGAVFLEYDARLNQGRIGQQIGQSPGMGAEILEVQH